jgi:hypothetical protein
MDHQNASISLLSLDQILRKMIKYRPIGSLDFLKIITFLLLSSPLLEVGGGGGEGGWSPQVNKVTVH